MIDPRNTQAMYVDSRPDVYGTDAYNKAFGLSPLTYGINNANGDVAKHNTIGLLTGNQVLPGLDMFNRGIDPQQIIKNAGLATAQGQYVNGSWQSNMADTYAARDQRIAALKAAGLSDSDARVEADRGYTISEQEPEPQQAAPMQQSLQPFQMTSQYQNYLQGNTRAPTANSYAQMGLLSNNFQSIAPMLQQAMQQQQTQQPMQQAMQQAMQPYQSQFSTYNPQQQAQQQQPRGLLDYASGGSFGNRYGLLSALGQ